MALINPYIHFNGNAEEAFTFYKSVFGGEVAKIMRYNDLSSPEYPVVENDANRLMHIALPIGKSNVLMASDVLEIMGQVTENDNRNTIFISAESREEADKLFNGLSEDGKVEMHCRRSLITATSPSSDVVRNTNETRYYSCNHFTDNFLLQAKACIQEKDYIEYRGKTMSKPLVKEINIDFRATDIKYLIVKSKRDIPKLIRTIKSAKKLVDNSDDADILSTNIITIEQLNNDF